jgi:hypothetical protein
MWVFFWTDDINYISQLLSFKIKKNHLSPVKVKKTFILHVIVLAEIQDTEVSLVRFHCSTPWYKN